MYSFIPSGTEQGTGNALWISRRLLPYCIQSGNTRSFKGNAPLSPEKRHTGSPPSNCSKDTRIDEDPSSENSALSPYLTKGRKVIRCSSLKASVANLAEPYAHSCGSAFDRTFHAVIRIYWSSNFMLRAGRNALVEHWKITDSRDGERW